MSDASKSIFAGFLFLAGARLSIAAGTEERAFDARPAQPNFTLAQSLTLPGLDVPPPDRLVDLLPPQPAADSSKQFRQHGPSMVDPGTTSTDPLDLPAQRSTTVWQRLQDYRSRNRVRLLTLWESGGSSLSLQTDKKGDPSLQWTSRLLNRGGATRGLLDNLFSVSIAGASSKLHDGGRAAPSAVQASRAADSPAASVRPK